MARSAKSKGRLSKKELKQDKLVELAYKIEHLYERHQKWVLYVAAGIVVAVVVGFVVHRSVQSGRMESSFQMTLAKMNYSSGRLDDARGAFERIASSIGGAAGAEAEYFLGRIAVEQGDYTGATTLFEKCLRSGAAGEEYTVAAMSGLAAAYEAQARETEAAKTYVEIADRYRDNVFAPFALSEAARIYLKVDQYDDAKIALRRIRDEHGQSTIAAQAKRKLDSLP